MIMWDKPENEYIKVYDFINFSEELLGVTKDEGKAQVISWLENREAKIRIYINFKGYSLIDDAEGTPYQFYSQCNYIHAWAALIFHTRSRLIRRLKGEMSGEMAKYLTSSRAVIDKVMASKHITSKHLPNELEPMDPIELKKGQKVNLGSNKPFSNDSSVMLNEASQTELKDLYFKKEELLKIVSPADIDESRDQQILRLSNEKRSLEYEKYSRDNKITRLENQLAESQENNAKNQSRIEQLEQLTGKIEQANSDESSVQAEPVQSHLYDWSAMNKYQYPPELHLAKEIWEAYYSSDTTKYLTKFDSGRFNRIATEFGLGDNTLRRRIRTLITPYEGKVKAPELVATLKEIDIIYSDKLEQD